MVQHGPVRQFLFLDRMGRNAKTQKDLFPGMLVFILPDDLGEFGKVPHMPDIQSSPEKREGLEMHMGIGKGGKDAPALHVRACPNLPVWIGDLIACKQDTPPVFNQELECPVLIFTRDKVCIFKNLHAFRLRRASGCRKGTSPYPWGRFGRVFFMSFQPGIRAGETAFRLVAGHIQKLAFL